MSLFSPWLINYLYQLGTSYFYFIHLFIISTKLWYFWHCFSFGYWKVPQPVPLTLDRVCPFTYFLNFLNLYWYNKDIGSSWTFLAPALESAISPRSPNSFYCPVVLKPKIWTPGALWVLWCQLDADWQDRYSSMKLWVWLSVGTYSIIVQNGL